MVGLPDTPTTFDRITIDELEPESFRQIVLSWRAQRGTGRCPEVAKIDPFVVPALAANLLLFEVDGERLVYRVLGEKVVTAADSKLRGRSMREVFGNTDYVRTTERQLLECAASATPFYSCHEFDLSGSDLSDCRKRGKAWRVALPYGDGDRVTRLLCYQLFSPNIEYSIHSSIDFEALLPKTISRIEV